MYIIVSKLTELNIRRKVTEQNTLTQTSTYSYYELKRKDRGKVTEYGK